MGSSALHHSAQLNHPSGPTLLIMRRRFNQAWDIITLMGEASVSGSTAHMHMLVCLAGHTVWSAELDLTPLCVWEKENLPFIVFTKMITEADQNNKKEKGGSLYKPFDQKIAAIVHAGRDQHSIDSTLIEAEMAAWDFVSPCCLGLKRFEFVRYYCCVALKH